MKKKGEKPESWLKTIAVLISEEEQEEIAEVKQSFRGSQSATGRMLIQLGLEAYRSKGSAVKELAKLRGS
jgi:hypothetical protein